MKTNSQLWKPLIDSPYFGELERRLSAGESGVCLSGLVEGSRALVLALLAARGRKLMLVLPDDNAVEAYRRDLAALGSQVGRALDVVTLPALDADPYDDIAPHPEVVRERVVALSRLARGTVDVLTLPVRALLNPVPSAESWRKWTHNVRRNDELPPDRFVLSCMGLGYKRVDIVSAAGEISRRGGIVDIFPPTAPEPVRIELFGDTVDSLRAFDTDHQRSTGMLDQVVIGPAVENPPDDHAVSRLARYLEGGVDRSTDDARAVRQLRERLDTLHSQGYLAGFEALTRITAQESDLMFEHVAGFDVVVDEPQLTRQELERTVRELELSFEESGNRVFPPPAELFGDADRIQARLDGASAYLQELIGETPPEASSVIEVPCRSARTYTGRVAELTEDLQLAKAASTRTVFVMRAVGGAERLAEILSEYDLSATRIDAAGEATAPGGIWIGTGSLRSGFELPQQGLTVLTERDVFGEKRKAPDRKSKVRAAFLSDFRDLKNGDLVVHIDHGIASYAGLGRPKGGSLNRDFMILEFARGDRLFVPVDRLDLVQKYNGVGGSTPQLDRLGGPGWERVKAKVRKSVESMARELLELYARRKAARGHAFSQDVPWQEELESGFPYELTPDQERVVNEVKFDMQSTRTMDRLLVGDVGFGKTEVAVRAAFKAVMDGYQVAVLAPTTVLAAQHYETFRERYAPFPVRVDVVSRLRTAADVKATLRDVAAGSVDVLIGTHKLLSKDTSFRKLGLLIVDEEQRFGVVHKERLKTISIGIDVLSMTATPIPRTLQMSLAGVRDLSVIETPPPGRMAIKTSLVPFRVNVLGQAIRHEIRRKGQVFVVHNKVTTLPALVRAIQDMVPDARVVMAHGQMRERQLESVMLQFVNHEADVLVTTTIIENGLDIPRANTIIVNRADRFGLAQLYQLRGRVGRSHEHAYAYFVVPSRQHLTQEARKRLRALQEFSDLGAGFRLAAADLEIRGAGELLGKRQHGQIAALGFDLYCQMLERAVSELQGEPVAERQSVVLHLGVDIKIPQTLLADAGDRLVIYKRLAQATTPSEIDRLQAETEDRYGHLPPAAKSLFNLGHVRLVAEEAGVKSIDLVEGKLQIRFHESPPIEPAHVLELVANQDGSLTPSGMIVLPAPPRGTDRIEAVRGVLHKMLGRSAA
ncbi:MAG: transcription-repair coupling factor [bacterium]|nr:transcription-repair coupling factor [bacterium]